ncbi:hypothetical protein KAJ27_04415 [bacterium]|nr:hypothetical protein [bacterium]
MVKIVQVGNLNLCPQYYYLDPETLAARQKDFFDNFVSSVDFAIEEKADFYLITSNFFDIPKPDPRQVSSALQQFDRLTSVKCEIIIGSGPCDISKDDAVFSCDSFLGHDGISVFSEKEVSPLTFQKYGKNIVFYGKKYFHKSISSEMKLNGLKEKDLNVIVLDREHIDADSGKTLYFGMSKEEMYSNGINIITTVGKESVQLNGKNALIQTPGLEKVSFKEIDHLKGFHLITIENKNDVSVEFKRLPCRPMEIVKIDLSLSTSSILNEIKKRIKRGRKDKILKLALTGKVLFEIYKNYSRLEVENILGNRFFFHVIENEIQIEDLEIDKFDDIRIFSVEKEFSNLLDSKIEYYKKKKDSDYSKFYKNVRQLGLKYLKN